MAVTFVDAAEGTGTETASPRPVTLTLPVTTAEDDVVYVANGCSAADAAMACSDVTYSEILPDIYADDTTDSNLGIFRKVQGSTPDTTVELTASVIGTFTSTAILIVLRGADTTTPEDATTTQATGTSSPTPDPASIVTATAGAWVAAFAMSSEADVPTAPTNYDLRVDIQASNRSLMAATREIASPTTEDPGTFGNFAGTTADSWCAFTVAVKPAAGGGGTIPIPAAWYHHNFHNLLH